MKKEFENLLYQRYPDLFSERTLPPDLSSMCWGLRCGDGWFDLIDALCKTMQSEIDNSGAPRVRFVQIKEKLGTLRVHIQGGNERIRGMIDMACAVSLLISEN